jgi:hypothetical protein
MSRYVSYRDFDWVLLSFVLVTTVHRPAQEAEASGRAAAPVPETAES